MEWCWRRCWEVWVVGRVGTGVGVGVGSVGVGTGNGVGVGLGAAAEIASFQSASDVFVSVKDPLGEAM